MKYDIPPERVESIEGADTDVFSELVELAGLEPELDFRSSNLAGVDFQGSALARFDFSFADLRNASWMGRLSDPKSVMFSLRGESNGPVVGADFEVIEETALTSKLWSERFFAFKMLVDNWGENEDTYDVLKRIIKLTDGTYIRVCSFAYFAASYNQDEALMADCINMAHASNSRTNMYKLNKMRRVLPEYVEYFSGIKRESRYPGDINPSMIANIGKGVSEILLNHHMKRF